MYTRRKSSKAIWIILLIAVLLLGAGAAAWFVTPGVSTPQVGKGNVILQMEDGGQVLMTWPESPSLQRVSIRTGEEKEYETLGEFDQARTTLDGALLEKPLHIRIEGVSKGKNLLGMERELRSGSAIEILVQPYSSLTPVLTGEGGEALGELLLSWDGRGSYELGVLEDGGYRALQEVVGSAAVLRFGEEEGELPLPGYDDPMQLTLRAIREGDGYVLYGPPVQPLEVRREMLLGSNLSLECQQLEERTYALRWNETKGDHYEIQEWSGAANKWLTLAQVERDGELRYETGLLRSGSDHRYRVVSVGGEEPVEPAEVSLRAGISTLYATVWPVVPVDFYEDAVMSRSLGKIPAGTALCVLEERDDAFQVRYKDQYGWVDNRFCMINLPEYVGDVCAYDITNSYSSIFMVHENPIEFITGQVVQGFEGILTVEDGFLAPYLYPCAKKLLIAAQAAEADGYRLRIYEAFRPNEATRFLYDTTLSQLDYPVPVIDPETNDYMFYVPPEPPPEPEPEIDPETGLPIADPDAGDGQDTEEPAPETMPGPTDDAPLEVPPVDGEPDFPPEDNEVDALTILSEADSSEMTEEPQLPEDSEGGLQKEPQPEEPEQPLEELENSPFKGPTFRQVMTDGRFGISSFLAAVVSAHNRGIALDLTIEYLDGRPLEMQSSMHDLSWYSATYLNNDNARLLESYMTMPGVEMRGLTSEWWHFQDDQTRESIKLTSYLYKGVTAEGWTRDENGWRWRDAKGSYARNTTLKIDGKTYAFDAQGYAVE